MVLVPNQLSGIPSIKVAVLNAYMNYADVDLTALLLIAQLLSDTSNEEAVCCDIGGPGCAG
jgi:hypothetical protein